MTHGQPIPLSEIECPAGTQLRDNIVPALVETYAEAMQAGDAFPPIVVFYEPDSPYLVADGYHRLEAARRNRWDTITCDVRMGGLREAMLFAAGANGTHGLSRTIEEKRRAVLLLLADPEWSAWPDREIARRCHVSHPFVAKLRADPAIPLAPVSPPAGSATTATRPASKRHESPLPATSFAFAAFRKITGAVDHLPEPLAVAQKLPRRQRQEWAERADRLSTWFAGLAEAARQQA